MCYTLTNQESAGSAAAVSTDKVQSNSSDHPATVDQASPVTTTASLKSSTPRHAVRFAAELSRPPPLEVTTGVDVHQAGASPPHSANTVQDALQQPGSTGAPRSVTARISSPPGQPRSVAV